MDRRTDPPRNPEVHRRDGTCAERKPPSPLAAEGLISRFIWELRCRRRSVGSIPTVDLNYQRLIIAYHGCDASVVTTVLSGEDTLAPSEKGHDWLGPGLYFWEHGPQRAYDWACDEKQRDPEKIQTPAVLGAYINLGQCFDLLDAANTRLLQRMHPEFLRLSLESGRTMPENKPAPGREDPCQDVSGQGQSPYSLANLPSGM